MKLEILKTVVANFLDKTHDDRGTGEGFHREFACGHFEHSFTVAQDIIGDLAFALCKMLFGLQSVQQFHGFAYPFKIKCLT